MAQEVTAYLKRNLYLFYSAQVLDGLRFMAPVWVLFFSHYLSFFQIGLLEAIGLLVSVGLELPTGALADLIGRKYSIIFGYILAGCGYILIGFAHSFDTFLLGYIVSSFGSSFVSGADTAMLFDTLKAHDVDKDFSKYSGRKVFFSRSAIVIAMILGQYMYAIFIGLPYIAVGITTILAGFVYIFATEPNKKIGTFHLSFTNYLSGITHGFHEAFKDTETTKLSLYFLSVASIELLLLWFYYAPYIHWIGYGALNIGFIYAAIAVTRTLASLASHKIDIFLGEKKLSIMLPIVLGFALLLSFIRNIYLGTFLLFIHYSLFTLRYTVLDKYTNMRFVSTYRASALSTLNMFVSLIYALFLLLPGRFVSLNSVGYVLTFFGIILLGISLPFGISFSRSIQRKES